MVERCPRDDRPWRQVMEQAKNTGLMEDLLARVQDVAARHPDRWEPSWVEGECLLYLRRRAESEAPYQEALKRARAATDDTGVVCAANRLGQLAFRGGEAKSAEELYGEALAAGGRAERPDMEGAVLMAWAHLRREAGDLSGAQRYLEQAIPRLAADRPRFARSAAYNRTTILFQLGDAAQALKLVEALYDEWAPLARENGRADDASFVARLAQTLGNIHRTLGDAAAAKKWYLQVPEDDPEPAAVARANLGRTLLGERDLDGARKYLQQAIDLAQEQTTRQYAQAYLSYAGSLAGEPAAAREKLEDLLVEAEAAGATDNAWIIRRLLGRTWLDEGLLPEAIAALETTVDILEGMGGGLDSPDQGLRFLRLRSQPYSDLAFCYASAATTATETAASTPAAVAPEHVGSPAASLLSVMEKAHARSLRQASGQVVGGSDAAAQPGTDQQAAAAEQPVEERAAAEQRAAAERLATIQNGLPEGTVLLAYLIGTDHGAALAIDPDRVQAVPMPGWRVLSEPLGAYRTALQRPLISAEAFADPAADLRRSIDEGKRLTELLLAPVREMLAGVTRIYLVPDQELGLLPFASLPWSASGEEDDSDRIRFLGEFFEVATLPLTGVPPAGLELGAPVLLAGDPLPDATEQFSALPHARQELEDIQALWNVPDDNLITGEELTAGRFRDMDLAAYRIIHVASHATASTRDPERCAVICSRGEPLGIDAIAGLKLGPSLVVLSACRTGEGEIIPGEGLIGLGWAFLQAGAAGLAVSLWSVEDQSTAEIMVAFHGHLRQGADPVTALTRAQRTLIERGMHPAFWSPFVLVLRPEES